MKARQATSLYLVRKRPKRLIRGRLFGIGAGKIPAGLAGRMEGDRMRMSEDNLRDELEEARSLRSAGRLQETKECLGKILKQKPRCIPALIEMGLVLTKESNHEDAASYYKRILEIKPDDTYALNELALTYSKQGNFRKATELFNRVLEKNPADNYVLSELGLIYTQQGDTEMAARYFEQIAKYSRSLFTEQFKDSSVLVTKTGDLTRRDKDFIVSGRITTANAMATCFAHQINNPLQIIQNSIDRLQKKIRVSEIALEEDLQRIRTAAGRIHNLIQHLYSLIKHESRNYEFIILNKVILNAFGLFEQQLRSRGITVNLDEVQDSRNTTVVYGNTVELEQVFINLIANARDALVSSADPRITVGMMLSSKDEITIHFCDNGIGISKQDLDRVFDSLFTTKPNGTGLGLWLCLSVIHQMNGTIEVESDLGKGTKCIICLPRQAR